MDAVTQSLVEVGIDTGGTFTDVVCYRDGRSVGVTKVPSTPSDPSIAILEAVAHLGRAWCLTSAPLGHIEVIA
ncbi:MAG: hydantoinase/oxoprolinase N-terminal domain-containing protein [Rhodospirillales bacterium]|nr:hydantoinase/oxoprolinase N-terminal domain-containing protein [Rhodospirillales bacterium]